MRSGQNGGRNCCRKQTQASASWTLGLVSERELAVWCTQVLIVFEQGTAPKIGILRSPRLQWSALSRTGRRSGPRVKSSGILVLACFSSECSRSLSLSEFRVLGVNTYCLKRIKELFRSYYFGHLFPQHIHTKSIQIPTPLTYIVFFGTLQHVTYIFWAFSFWVGEVIVT